MKPQVGQKVFLRPVNNAARGGNKVIKKYEVKSVGRKYFEVWDGLWVHSGIKFHLDSLREVTEYTSDYALYFSVQEILDEDESNDLVCNIRGVFGSYGKIGLTLAQLRNINTIIKEETQ